MDRAKGLKSIGSLSKGIAEKAKFLGFFYFISLVLLSSGDHRSEKKFITSSESTDTIPFNFDVEAEWRGVYACISTDIF